MKKCKNCGKENNDISVFCSNCGANDFESVSDSGVELEKRQNTVEPLNAPQNPTRPLQPGQPMPPPPPPTQIRPAAPVQPPRGTYTAYQQPFHNFGVFDVLTILGFISSILGLFYAWVVLEPLGVIASILGFFKGNKKHKGLAAAGFIIAILAFLIKLIYSLYVNGVLGKWAIEGIFT